MNELEPRAKIEAIFTRLSILLSEAKPADALIRWVWPMA